LICLSFNFTILSPACNPAASAAYPSEILDTTAGSQPTHATRIAEKINASIKLKTGPAAMTLILAHTDLELKLPSDMFSGSSSPIIHAPPIGRSLKLYFVPPITLDAIHGPIPTENSSTSIPFFFAIRKCPSSCEITTIPNNTNASKIPTIILPPAFYSLIYLSLYFQYFLHRWIYPVLMCIHAVFYYLCDCRIRNPAVEKPRNSCLIGGIKYCWK